MNDILPIFILIYLFIGIVITMGFIRYASKQDMHYSNATIILTILLWPYLAAMSASATVYGLKELHRDREF